MAEILGPADRFGRDRGTRRSRHRSGHDGAWPAGGSLRYLHLSLGTSPKSRLRPLDDVRAQLAETSALARSICAGRTTTEIARRAETGRWSIGEQLEHLSLTTEAYLPVLESAADELRARGERSEGPFRTDLMGRFLLWMLEPPVRKRVKTAPRFLPRAIERPEQCLPRFLALQDRLVERTHAFEGLALDRARVRSPFDPRIGYSAWSCLRIVPAHQRRHLWIAQETLRALERGVVR